MRVIPDGFQSFHNDLSKLLTKNNISRKQLEILVEKLNFDTPTTNYYVDVLLDVIELKNPELFNDVIMDINKEILTNGKNKYREAAKTIAGLSFT